MFQSINHKNPRKLLNSWEAQALATLTAKNLPNSFKAVSEIMHDETKDIEVRTASEILFWGSGGTKAAAMATAADGDKGLAGAQRT